MTDNREKFVLEKLKDFLCVELTRREKNIYLDQETMEMITHQMRIIEHEYDRYQSVKNMRFICDTPEIEKLTMDIYNPERFKPQEPKKILCSALNYHIRGRIKSRNNISEITAYQNVKLECRGAIEELHGLLVLVQENWSDNND